MEKYIKVMRDFSGGLSEAANDNMTDNQLVQAQNVIPGDGYGIERTFGVNEAYPKLDTSVYDQHAAALFRLTLADGITQTLVFTVYESESLTYQNIYLLNEDGTAWTTVATAQQPRLDGFIYAHKLYWLTGTDYKVWDGTTLSSLAVTPAGDSATTDELAVWNKVRSSHAVEQRGHRWFYANAHDEVIFSNVGDPASVTVTNIINVVTGDDDHITALREFNDGMLIFKRMSVHYLRGWDLAGGSDVTLTRLNATCGTLFPDTVCVTEAGVLYLGENGVYRLYVPSNSNIVAAQNISEQKISHALFGDGSLSTAFAVVWDNIYFLTVQSVGSDLRREYRYYPSLNAFFGPFTQQPCCYARLDGQLFIGLNQGYLVYYDKSSRSYLDTATGALVAIPILAETKGFDVAGTMVCEVKLKKVLLCCRQYLSEGSHLTLRVKADYADLQFSLDDNGLDESLVWDEGRFGESFWGWKNTVCKQMQINRKAQRVSIYFSDAHADEPLLIYGVGLLYKKRKLHGSKVGVERTDVNYE